MAKATARHILVATEDKCNELKAQIEGAPISQKSPKPIPAAHPAVKAATWARSVQARWLKNSTPSCSAPRSTPCKAR